MVVFELFLVVGGGEVVFWRSEALNKWKITSLPARAESGVVCENVIIQYGLPKAISRLCLPKALSRLCTDDIYMFMR